MRCQYMASSNPLSSFANLLQEITLTVPHQGVALQRRNLQDEFMLACYNRCAVFPCVYETPRLNSLGILPAVLSFLKVLSDQHIREPQIVEQRPCTGAAERRVL